MFKAILAKQANKNAAIRELLVGAEEVKTLLIKNFDKTIQDFSSKPKVQSEIKQDTRRIVTFVYIEDKIYTFLSKGTRVRYATMTKGFVAKTKPGRIASRPGSGGVFYISKNKPRPGIKARNFDDSIVKANERLVYFIYQRAVKRFAIATGHQIRTN